MTIDERLDRLTERHEALTQTAELLAHAQEDGFRKNDALVTRVVGLVESLTRVVQCHERRISGLEDGPT